MKLLDNLNKHLIKTQAICWVRENSNHQKRMKISNRSNSLKPQLINKIFRKKMKRWKL